jgi:hypothetical protein
MKRTASCSDVQQLAERLMIGEFSRQLGRQLGKATIPIGKARVTVDGFHKDENRVTLVEAWAHVGKAKFSAAEQSARRRAEAGSRHICSPKIVCHPSG